jgi:hypothetical protein
MDDVAASTVVQGRRDERCWLRSLSFVSVVNVHN